MSARPGRVRLPCLDLRLDGPYGGEADEVPEIAAGSDAAVYRCLRTMLPIGPDGADARPDACGPGRSCCEPP
jgi:hypothetical protein